MLITCSSCHSKIKVPDAAAGKRGKCPKCGTVITIPALEPEELVEEPAGGSPFAFDEDAPAPKKGRRPADEDEIEEAPPPRKKKSRADDDVEEADEEGATTPAKGAESKGLSITSLVLGILSLLCGCGTMATWFCAPLPLLCAVGAIVTGLMGMKRGARTMGIVGASLGGVSIVLTIIAVLVNIFFVGAMITAGAMKGMK